MSNINKDRIEKEAKAGGYTGLAVMLRYLNSLLKTLNKEMKNILIEGSKMPSPIAMDSNNSWIMSQLNSLLDRYTIGMEQQYKSEAEKFTDKINRRDMELIEKQFKIEAYNGEAMQELLSLNVDFVVSQINGLVAKQITQVKEVTQAAIISGSNVDTTAKKLQKIFKTSPNKTRLMSRNLTNKVNSSVSIARQKRHFTKFRWLNMDDGRVRQDHRRIAKDDVGFGKGIYEYKNPPKNEKGEQIMPSEDYNCRCKAIPVLG